MAIDKRISYINQDGYKNYIKNSDSVEMVMLNGRLYDAKTMNEMVTGNSKRLPHWWEK